MLIDAQAQGRGMPIVAGTSGSGDYCLGTL